MWPFSPHIKWHIPEGRYDLVPQKATPGSMAYDLVSPTNHEIPANGQLLLNTLVAVTMPKGYAMIFGSRSGMAYNQKVTVEGGWIDNDYRGLLKVLLYNHGDQPVQIVAGQRIAQAMLIKTHQLESRISFQYPDTNSTKRGAGGFGSTGK
jgi:dUTP pyrophosphatase